MARSGNVDEPTTEFPSQTPGLPAPTGHPAAGSGDAGPPAEPSRPGRGPGRGLVVLAAGLAVVLTLVLGGRALDIWPDLRNPFAKEQTDRSQPPLLQSMRDLSRYVAAEGNFQVVIDLQDNRQYVPEFLLNERTLFVAAGSVDAYVDFSTLADGAVVQNAEARSVEVRLPAPQLDDAALDLDRSYVFAEERGLLNRLGELFGGDPNRQREVYRLAEERIATAARDSGLRERAQENTRKMLEGLLRSLGYTTVTVTFPAA
jgi:hypothetical protein